MPERESGASIKSRLREEYFSLLPKIRRVATQLEAEIRYHVLPVVQELDSYEQVIVRSRVKDCESAVEKLLRRHEGNIADPDGPVESLLTLKDLAGVRVLVFPGRRLGQVDAALRKTSTFRSWEADPLKYAGGSVHAPKYYGTFETISSEIQGEYQIVPMLIGDFWDVEHSAMYKPVGWAKGADRDPDLKTLRTEIERALLRFEEKFENFVEQNRRSTPTSQ